MAELPSGTVTFLFTDIEGSTTRWEHQPEAMQRALARHDALIRAAVRDQGGHVVKTMGDAFHAAFSRAADAVAAALDAQRRLEAESWGEGGPLRVRMALHTGAAEERGGDYYGAPLNRAARLVSVAHAGQVLLSQTTYDLIRDTPPEGARLLDLGEHRLKDLIRPERVFQIAGPGLFVDFPPLQSLDARSHNLPVHPSALLGRERDVARARERLLRDDVRLLTLTGPGGTGKTRLALQIAAEAIDQFADGVFFVALAPISDPGLVASTIAQALGVRETGTRPIVETLQEHLGGRQILLLLDNFEQVLAAAPLVSDLLGGAPRMRILVTSRAPLRVRGEHEYAVPPLALPDRERTIGPAALSQYGAVALFVERAAAIKGDFTVTNENAPAIAEICHRLDGLPLAIELAAARTRLLSPQAILARLERRLPLLTGGARDLPARQQTLRNAIAWSYDLLIPEEQALYRQLGMFVGGWTLEAAEAVCNPEGALGLDVLDGLTSLAAQSLLRHEDGPDGESRFGMLETIREYALEQLQASGELGLLGRRHAAHFLGLTGTARAHLNGPDQTVWLDRLERDHDNLRAALRWAIEREDAEVGIRLARGLAVFWETRGHYSEDRSFHESILALPAGPELDGLRAELFQHHARVAQQQGDSPVARAFAEEALAIARRVGDRAVLVYTLNTLGFVMRVQGEYATARPALEECLALARESGRIGSTATALLHLGLLTWEADRDGDTAWSLYEQSLALAQDTGDRRLAGYALSSMGSVARARGDAATTRALMAEALAISGELGEIAYEPHKLYVLAALNADAGRLDRAVRIAAAAVRLAESIGSRTWPSILRERDAWLEPARAALGGEAFARAWAAGQAMTRERAVAYALEDPGSIDG
jgi:predicted ATPase/class 3 adenylate cyclase